MTTGDRFDMFAKRLDEEWLRARLRATANEHEPSEAAIFEDLVTEDPLQPIPSLWDTVRGLVAAWPVRFALTASVAALLLVGFILGRVVATPPPLVAQLPLPVYEPAKARAPRVLGAGPVKPESLAKFQDAMAYHGTGDFARRGLPILQEAVRLDPSNGQAQFWLGVALLQADRPAEAVAPLEIATNSAPTVRTYRLYLLFALLRSASYVKAGQTLSELMRSESVGRL